MIPAEVPQGHGFKSGGFQTGQYRVLCACGERFSGSDSATAHAYWREHLAEVRESVEVEQ